MVAKLKELEADLLEKTLLCFLSSSSHEQDKRRAQTLGVNFYYEKPLAEHQLEEILSVLKSRF